MNDQSMDPASPDFLEVQPVSSGVRRGNKRPLYIGIGFASLVIIGLAIAAYVRAENQQAKRTAAETYQITSAAVAPIKKPPGPDVEYPPTMPMYTAQGQQIGVPMQEDEATKQARAKKAAELDAANKAVSGVESFSTRRHQPGQPQPVNYVPPGMPGINGLVSQQPNDEGDIATASDSTQLAQQRAFLMANKNESTYLDQKRKAPISKYEIKAGFVIPGTLISGVNSTLPGLITAQVRQNVYDSATGRYVLIPAGSRLLGTYDSSISGGQQRMFVAWNRILFPDSSSIQLEGMPGADQSGIAGFEDQVNNHYVRTFGQAFMLSLFSAGIQLSQPRGAVSGTYNAQQIGAAAIGQQLGQLGMQIARRNLAMQPTLEIRPGFNFTIVVNKDMVLPPWTGHPLQNNVAAVAEVPQEDVSGTYQQGY